MKKLVIAACAVLLVLGGCGSKPKTENKNLVCKIEEETGSINVVYAHDADTLTSLKQENVTNINKLDEAQKAAAHEQMTAVYTQLDTLLASMEGVKHSWSESDGVFTETIEMDFTKVSDEAMNQMGMNSNQGDWRSLKFVEDSMKKSGMTCVYE